jgi:hypothetical protein
MAGPLEYCHLNFCHIKADLLVFEGFLCYKYPLCGQPFYPTHFDSHSSFVLFSFSMTSASSSKSLAKTESSAASAVFPSLEDDVFSSRSQVEQFCSHVPHGFDAEVAGLHLLLKASEKGLANRSNCWEN